MVFQNSCIPSDHKILAPVLISKWSALEKREEKIEEKTAIEVELKNMGFLLLILLNLHSEQWFREPMTTYRVHVQPPSLTVFAPQLCCALR